MKVVNIALIVGTGLALATCLVLVGLYAVGSPTPPDHGHVGNRAPDTQSSGVDLVGQGDDGQTGEPARRIKTKPLVREQEEVRAEPDKPIRHVHKPSDLPRADRDRTRQAFR